MADDMDVVDGIAEVLPKTIEAILEKVYYYDGGVASSLKPRYVRKLHRKWGSTELTTFKNNVTQLLLTFEGPGLDQDNIDVVAKKLYESCGIVNSKKSKFAEIHQFRKLQAIVYLFRNEDFNALGEAFMANKLSDLKGHKVLRIEPVEQDILLTKAYVEIVSKPDEGDKIHDHLDKILQHYSGAMGYVSVREPETSQDIRYYKQKDLTQGKIAPSMILSLRFVPVVQDLGGKLQSYLETSKDWAPIQLTDTMSKVVNVPGRSEIFYAYKEYGIIPFSVRQGAVAAGAVLKLYIGEKYKEMKEFYSTVTGQTAYDNLNVDVDVTEYCKFLLAKDFEIMIIHVPDEKTVKMEVCRLCFELEDPEMLISKLSFPVKLTPLADNYWQATDPCDNNVIFYKVEGHKP
ncbi:hypothetical protein TrispH2_008206 [Trichoplax sp. H2]|nr:hypothetical protein TrispH2_008206 [Trichoplax sp. H2]|eukprot:RDD38694.1 hypothetical protein TrispH2_008206 [Trichoplax sp. H2]